MIAFAKRSFDLKLLFKMLNFTRLFDKDLWDTSIGLVTPLRIFLAHWDISFHMLATRFHQAGCCFQ
jgi:hypothetical protein